MTKIHMSVSLAGLSLKTPVMTASGTCGYGLDLLPYLDLSRLGALVVKGISVEPRQGNPPPRIIETAAGMLNAIGLENIGMEAFLTEILPQIKEYRTVLIVNILGESKEEYARLVDRLSEQEESTASRSTSPARTFERGESPSAPIRPPSNTSSPTSDNERKSP
jgi:dihydroorotate dehydrogenase (NAD+) catalytic subunit